MNAYALLTLACLYVLASIACFTVYAIDKLASRRAGARRVRESTLLWMGLGCGWPGGWLAQRWLRHKTAKPGFLWKFRATVVLNLALAALLIWVTSNGVYHDAGSISPSALNAGLQK